MGQDSSNRIMGTLCFWFLGNWASERLLLGHQLIPTCSPVAIVGRLGLETEGKLWATSCVFQL